MMVSSRVLVVDDELEIVEMITLFLERENYAVMGLTDSTNVLEMVTEWSPDLVIMDVLLPGMDGIELCHHLRKFVDIPVLFVSCKSEDLDKVIGLTAGGDDYITKPFSPIELVARVKAHLRRNRMISKRQSVGTEIMKYDELEINLMTQEVQIEGKTISLSAREFKLLSQLAQHPGRIYSMNELYERVWGTDSISDTRTVMVHISNLRKKLELDPSNPLYIQTVRGAGYKFIEKLATD